MYLENEPKIAFKAMKREKSVQINAAVSDSPPDVACRKKRYVSTISDVISSIAER